MALQSIQLSTNVGTGSKLAADQLAGGEYAQYVKLLVGTADSEVPLAVGAGTAATALRVELASDTPFALKTGTAVIGEVTIGAATGAAGDLAKIEDVLAASGDVGVACLFTQQASPSNLAGAGDYCWPQMSAGRLWAWSAGDIADDAAAGTQPVLCGGYAIATDGTDPGSVSAEGDAAQFRTDRNRRLLVNVAHPNLFNTSDDYAAAQTNATVKAAPGANLSLYITDIHINNGATAGECRLLDGSGGTILFETNVAANETIDKQLSTPIRLTANTLLAFTSVTMVQHFLNASGYTAP